MVHPNGITDAAVVINDKGRRLTAVEKLRAMLADKDRVIACPGVYDGFTARIVLQEGFDVLYMVCLNMASI